jgi:peptide/nickel transport system substrate-binding protein
MRRIEQGFDHNFDMMISEYWFGLPLDPDYLCACFHSSQAERGFNSAGYTNPEFDELAVMQRRELDPSKRRQLVWKMQETLAADLPWVPLFNNLRIDLYRNDTFEGWVGRPSGLPPYSQVWSYLKVKRVAS